MRSATAKRVATLALRLAALVPVAAAAGLLFAWSGIYNVAASRDHWAITEWALAFVMRNSVENRAFFVDDPPKLDDPDLITLGAGHFHSGCAPCHGAPGMPFSPVARAMLPPPPDLAIASTHWSDRELFWIVRHGIKYTGMPSWPAVERGDEVWSMVAFLRQLPGLDAQSYRRLASAGRRETPPSVVWKPTDEGTVNVAESCARCHGAETTGPSSRLVPMLHGQSPDYLLASLRAYSAGLRPSGIMQPVASDLDRRAMRLMADYYAGLTPPRRDLGGRDRASVDRGRRIAMEGLPGAGVPPCLSCHGREARAMYPRLDGQSAIYLAAQLRLWRQGLNTATPAAQIMAPIAQRLNDRQVDDLSAYFAGLAPARTGDPP